MKKLNHIFLLGILVTGACSKSRLELTNPNQITTQTFWKTEADVLAGLAATYNSFVTQAQTGLFSVRGVEVINGRGDDFFIRNDVRDLYTLSTFTNAPDNGVVSGYWNTCYQGILAANQVIANAPNVSMDATRKAQDIAEAKFLRGVYYFCLVTNFGDVPLRLTVPESASAYYVAKSPADSVWSQIGQDFSEAAAALPASYPSNYTGRATQGAAIGYLGKAYLYQKQYAQAEAAFKKIMSGQYSLVANFGDNFDVAHKNNAESVFEIQVNDVGGSGVWSTGAGASLGVSTAQEFAPAQVAGWFELYPTDKLLTEFMKEMTPAGNYDARLPATLVWQGEDGTKGSNTTFYTSPIASFFPTEFGYKARIKKYQNFNQTGEVTGENGSAYVSSINERVLRYADVLLMHAEAVAMQGRPQDAYPDVNAIRERAGLADLAGGSSQTQMMTEIQHQRMIEFAREGLRFYDLERWGLTQQAMAGTDKQGAQYYVPGKFDLFPVPQSELDNNPLMKQSAGW